LTANSAALAATLAAAIVIDLRIEHLVFDTLERSAVRPWGVQQ
jgi:hypothetical protein